MRTDMMQPDIKDLHSHLHAAMLRTWGLEVAREGFSIGDTVRALFIANESELERYDALFRPILDPFKHQLCSQAAEPCHSIKGLIHDGQAVTIAHHKFECGAGERVGIKKANEDIAKAVCR